MHTTKLIIPVLVIFQAYQTSNNVSKHLGMYCRMPCFAGFT